MPRAQPFGGAPRFVTLSIDEMLAQTAQQSGQHFHVGVCPGHRQPSGCEQGTYLVQMRFCRTNLDGSAECCAHRWTTLNPYRSYGDAFPAIVQQLIEGA